MRVQVKVLNQFPYGDDGIHAVMLLAGETHEIHEELIKGLEAEGFVERVGGRSAPKLPKPNGPGENGSTRPGETKVDPVVIPEDWQQLPFMALRALATKIDPAANKKPECIAAIEAEVARRVADKEAAEKAAAEADQQS
jgi:hypothetical protein